jgi:hypothetical protein
LGADAADLDAAALSSVVLHAEQTTVDGAPPLTRHRPRALPDDAAIVRAIQSLPAPVPPRDGGTALALWRLSLLRAWCSSVHALDAMLRRALLAAAALHDALHAGRRPTRAELRGWSREDGQLAWPELLASGIAPGADALAATHTHIEALRTLRQQVAARQDLEVARIAAVGALLDRYREVPVLLCTQYAATVEALGQLDHTFIVGQRIDHVQLGARRLSLGLDLLHSLGQLALGHDLGPDPLQVLDVGPAR